jgi:hypothetical protein
MMPMELIKNDTIYIPDGERYGGVTDRQFIANRRDTESILSFAEDIVCCPQKLYDDMKHHNGWNVEQFLDLQLVRKGMWDRVRFYPYIMFTVRDEHEGTRWAAGNYDSSVNMIVKYPNELNSARYFAERIKIKEDWSNFVL